MADVDMTDAPSASGSAPGRKVAGKPKAAAGDGGVDGKKRFEVKKVRIASPHNSCYIHTSYLFMYLVECSSAMGMGYCCRQLCYLQKSHHGPL
jgi:hypothetical protein